MLQITSEYYEVLTWFQNQCGYYGNEENIQWHFLLR